MEDCASEALSDTPLTCYKVASMGDATDIPAPTEPAITLTPALEEALANAPVDVRLATVAIDYTRKVVVIRTNMGGEAARRLAEFELDGEVHISCIFDVKMGRLDLLKATDRKRKGIHIPPPMDYIFKRSVNPRRWRRHEDDEDGRYDSAKSTRVKSDVEQDLNFDEDGEE